MRKLAVRIFILGVWREKGEELGGKDGGPLRGGGCTGRVEVFSELGLPRRAVESYRTFFLQG